MNKQSFLSKLLAFITGGDAAKISRFATKLEKFYEKQIKIRTEAIDTLRDKIVDTNEAIDDSILAIDLGSINDTDGADSYCGRYHKKIELLVNQVEAYESSIKDHEDEIAKFKLVQGRIFAEGPAVPEAPVA